MGWVPAMITVTFVNVKQMFTKKWEPSVPQSFSIAVQLQVKFNYTRLVANATNLVPVTRQTKIAVGTKVRLLS